MCPDYKFKNNHYKEVIFLYWSLCSCIQCNNFGHIALQISRDKIKNLAVYNGDYYSPIALSQESTTEVIWWSENVEKLIGKSIRKSRIDFFIETDASTNG